jgi:hypothetical protein
MSRSRLLPLSLALVSLAASGIASSHQDPVPAEAAAKTLPAVRAVLDRYGEVSGMTRMVAETTSYKATGTIALENMGLRGDLTIHAHKPSMQLSTWTLGAMGTTSVGYDGEIAWMIQPMLGEMILEGEGLMGVVSMTAYGAMLMPEGDYDKLEVVGREEFEGSQCYRVHSVYQAPEDEELARLTETVRTKESWFDVETGLLAGSRSTQAGPTGRVEVTTVIQEYEKFGEYMLASKSLVKQVGVELIITVDAVEYDQVKPEIFNLPPAIKALLEEEVEPEPEREQG